MRCSALRELTLAIIPSTHDYALIGDGSSFDHFRSLGVVQRFHRQVRVVVGDMEAEVDSGIAHLIEALWECGVRTSNSCERQPNESALTWISYPSLQDRLNAESLMRVEIKDRYHGTLLDGRDNFSHLFEPREIDLALENVTRFGNHN